jgi:uncharacterized tellurite resistance protein B-like protein
VLEAINRFFRSRIAADPVSAEDPEHQLQIATCALLLEVAHADDEFCAEEQQLIREVVRRRFQFSGQEADELISLADQERQQSTDLYQFTRLISERFSKPQKLAVLELLWQVVYSDGQLEAHEDALIHKLSHLLGLKHQELIALKLRVKHELEQNPG